MSQKNVLIFFGGKSAEHEVSIITGLQVVENIDRDKFNPHIIYIHKNGLFDYKGQLTSRKDFQTKMTKNVIFGSDKDGGFIEHKNTLGRNKVYIDAAYLALHGGTGEDGTMQGFLQALGIPHTSPSHESSIIAMNKCFTKLLLHSDNLPTLTSDSIKRSDLNEIDKKIQDLVDTLSLPLIVKPAHLGSSIGIEVAHTRIDLEKAIRSALLIDDSALIEPYIESFTEYNISIRSDGDFIQTSPIEKPLSDGEILSFDDKYNSENGGKKTAAKGMASLIREIPADISNDISDLIKKKAIQAYKTVGAKGVVRIDFMIDHKKPSEPFITEINAIPGSMSFYLWEASGEDFPSQISHTIEDTLKQNKKSNPQLDYKTDIVEKFIGQ